MEYMGFLLPVFWILFLANNLASNDVHYGGVMFTMTA